MYYAFPVFVNKLALNTFSFDEYIFQVELVNSTLSKLAKYNINYIIKRNYS